jgi:hypothetical protein
VRDGRDEGTALLDLWTKGRSISRNLIVLLHVSPTARYIATWDGLTSSIALLQDIQVVCSNGQSSTSRLPLTATHAISQSTLLPRSLAKWQQLGTPREIHTDTASRSSRLDHRHHLDSLAGTNRTGPRRRREEPLCTSVSLAVASQSAAPSTAA